MKVAQMMIKTVLTVIVTVIDPLFCFFFPVLVLLYPLHFPPFYISCVPVMGGMTG